MRPGIEVRAENRRADYSWTGAEPDRESFEPWAWELYNALGGGNFSGRVALNDYLDSWPVYVSGGANMMSDGPGAYTLAPFAGEVLADVEIERSAEGGSMKVRPALRTACVGGGCIAHAAGKAYFLLYVVGEEPAYGETLRLYRADCSELGERIHPLYIVDFATVEQVYEADMEYNSATIAVSDDGGEVYIFTSGGGVQLTVVDTEDFTTRQRVTLLDGAEPALDFSYQWDRVDLLPGCIAVRVGGYTLAAAEIDGRYEPVCAVKDLSLPDNGAGSAGFIRRTHAWEGRRFALFDYGLGWYPGEDGTFNYCRLSVFEDGELSYCEWIYPPFGGELGTECTVEANAGEEERT